MDSLATFTTSLSTHMVVRTRCRHHMCGATVIRPTPIATMVVITLGAISIRVRIKQYHTISTTHPPHTSQAQATTSSTALA